MLREFALSSRVAGHATASGPSTPVEPAVPRAASTVVLLRDSSAGPEAFLLRRAASMAFAARMHVFPGGGVDPRDVADGVPWSGPSIEQWAERLSVTSEQAAGLVCAAVRELFEESGVLLAGPSGGQVVEDLGDDSWEGDRLALLDRSLALSELLLRRGLVLRSDLLRPWAHWCTPVWEPRRYDTWFFVADLPGGQRARDVGGEADHAAWVSAAAAVEGCGRGELAMMPPTLVTLEEVASHPDVASVLASPRTVSRVMPWLVSTGPDGERVVRVDLDGRGGGVPGPHSSGETTR